MAGACSAAIQPGSHWPEAPLARCMTLGMLEACIAPVLADPALPCHPPSEAFWWSRLPFTTARLLSGRAACRSRQATAHAFGGHMQPCSGMTRSTEAVGHSIQAPSGSRGRSGCLHSRYSASGRATKRRCFVLMCMRMLGGPLRWLRRVCGAVPASVLRGLGNARRTCCAKYVSAHARRTAASRISICAWQRGLQCCFGCAKGQASDHDTRLDYRATRALQTSHPGATALSKEVQQVCRNGSRAVCASRGHHVRSLTSI